MIVALRVLFPAYLILLDIPALQSHHSFAFKVFSIWPSVHIENFDNLFRHSPF